MSTSTVLLVILAACLAAVLAWGQYFFKQRQKQWLLFSGLRFVTYFALFLLLINPKFRQTRYTVQKPDLAIAVDNSKSIRNFGEDSAVVDFVTKLTHNPDLKQRFDMQVYSFGTDFRHNDSLSFDEGRTDISAAFDHLENLFRAQTAPTILLTDGNQTYGQDYEFKAKNYAQPLYPVVVGDTATYADLKIDRLNANRYAFLHNKFPVEVFVNYEGEKAVAREFTITRAGKTVFRKKLEFDAEHKSAVVRAPLRANSVGVKTYKAHIAPLQNEKNTSNNTHKFAVEVIDEKTNVVLLSAFPHPDLGSFKKAITHNQQREADIKYIGKDKIDFGKYQLVILYQPNSSFKSAFETIKRLGINTLTVTGTDTDYRFLNGQQDFFHKEVTDQTEDYLPVYQEGYPSFQFDDIDFEEFPPLENKFGELSVKGGSHSLLNQSVDGFKRDSPLLMTIEKGKHRYGFLFGENSWRWRAKSFALEGDFKAYDEFFGKLIQYLASNKRRERLTINYKAFYNTGDPIVFQAHYFDENYRFDPRAKLYLALTNKKTDQTQQRPFLLKNNRYELDLSDLNPGEYDFTLKVEGESLRKTGSFTVIDFDVEKQFLNADVDKLSRISSRGPYFLDQSGKLVQDLLSNDDYKPVQQKKTETSPLIDWWYLLILMVLSLSVEWFLRKYKGLI